MPRTDPVASAVASIRRVFRVLRLTAQRTQAVAGISAAQVFVLEQLRADDCLSVTELAARTLTDRSSVADVVDRLAAQGLVKRSTDPEDRRRAAVLITAAGRRLVARAPTAPASVLIAAIRTMNPRERAVLAASLERLTVALGAKDDPATLLFGDDAPPARRPRRAPTKRKRTR